MYKQLKKQIDEKIIIDRTIKELTLINEAQRKFVFEYFKETYEE